MAIWTLTAPNGNRATVRQEKDSIGVVWFNYSVFYYDGGWEARYGGSATTLRAAKMRAKTGLFTIYHTYKWEDFQALRLKWVEQ